MKLQDHPEIPELTKYSEGQLGVLQSEIYKLVVQNRERSAGAFREKEYLAQMLSDISHQIKTPLTSIISYVQFLKQEENLPDHVTDYVKILDEKSQRLKNMVQDVFAVSKAASGELPMHMEELDFGRLLQQTLADMEEQIGKSQVRFRMEIPDGPILIMADGQRMYRVFQNLFQNALQYSLSGSRVYVSLKAEGNQAAARSLPAPAK